MKNSNADSEKNSTLPNRVDSLEQSTQISFMRILYFFTTIFLLGAMVFCISASAQQKAIGYKMDQQTALFIDSLQYKSFLFFWELADPETRLIPDRAPTPSFSSVAAIGFGLTTYLIGIEQKYIDRPQAADRILKLLKYLYKAPQNKEFKNVTGYKGLFYHFLDMKTGYRFKNVELSTIDTGVLMAGVLSCQSYFTNNGPVENQIRAYADSLYLRVEWDWAMNNKKTMSMGWHPEKGFINSYWNGYNEAMLLYILALGSPTHTISKSSWNEWTKTYVWNEFYGFEHLSFGPLFGHQYSQMYIDFRGIQDKYMRKKGIDYHENSRRATYSNRAYCIANPRKFKGYSEKIWGLTASDGPKDTLQFHSYWARGAGSIEITDDGTIAPTAAGGSIAFAPEICIPALQEMYSIYGGQLYGKYGFKDAFNPSYTYGEGNENGWFDIDYLGIDQGPIVIQIQNFRSEFVWNLMKKNPYIVDGLKKAGFKGGWLQTKK